MNEFEYDIDTKVVENEITKFIREVILNTDEDAIFTLLRANDYISITIPKMEVGDYIVNEFIAKVPRDIVEFILFDV